MFVFKIKLIRKTIDCLLCFLFISLAPLKAQDIPLLQTSFGHKAQVNTLSFSQDGEYLLTASNDQNVKLWNGRTFTRKHPRLPFL